MPYKETARRQRRIAAHIQEPLDVNIQDQTTEIIDLHLSRLVQAIVIVTNASLSDTVITVSSVGTPVAGNLVCLKEGSKVFQSYILSVAANASNWDLTLDSPLDYAFTTAGGCSERSTNMAVNGSVTPVEFEISPATLNSDVEWDIVRIIGQIIDSTSMDDTTFGGIVGGLTNGCVLRYEDGEEKNIFNIKTNGEIALRMYDTAYADKRPSGSFGFKFRRTFGGQGKNGVVIRLTAIHGDSLKLIIQDDLTGLDDFYIVAQGHRTD